MTLGTTHAPARLNTAWGTALALAVGAAQLAGAQDDHGDTSAEATLLAIGASVAGSLYSDQDTDYFRLDLVGLAEVQIRTSGQTNTAGELLDAAGGRLMSDDDSGAGDNFDIQMELQPGVYYVAVSGETGSYAVSARLGGDRDHGDTHESSTLLKLHTQDDLASVSPSVLLATAGRIYPSTTDTDVFRIDVAENETEVILRTAPSSYETYGVLRDATGRQVAADDDGDGAFQISKTLNRGIYYTSVNAIEVGAYRILGQVGPFGRIDRPGGAFTDALASGGEGPEMVMIPAGSFRMGCLVDDGDCETDEFPVLDMDVPGFALSKHEVTYAEWDACLVAGGCDGYRPKADYGSGSRPVANVSYNRMASYLAWLSAETGYTYRLPSEAEWEYAARAGTETKYHWGNEIGVDRAKCHGCNSDENSAGGTVPVGSFSANAWGLHDMHGNVWEAMADCWRNNHGGRPRDGSVRPAESCTTGHRVLRGGSHSSSTDALRAANRFAKDPRYGRSWSGFRVARDLTP